MKYKIADLIVEYEANYNRLKESSEKYRIDTNEPANFEIIVKKEDMEEDRKKCQGITYELAEYVNTCWYFYYHLLQYHGCLLHSSCIVVDDEAYLFSADCGGGKSTHSGLWLKYLADKKPYILNDDKPALRIFEDGIYAYGTPFSGKNDISENKKVKVKGICFLEQAPQNSIQKMDLSEAFKLFFEQTTDRVNKKENMEKLLDTMDIILRTVPVYKLRCNISEEAVQLAYTTMKGEKNEG